MLFSLRPISFFSNSKLKQFNFWKSKKISIYESMHFMFQKVIRFSIFSGTTWTQELVWSLLFGLDDPRINDVLTKRFPFFEWVKSLLGTNFFYSCEKFEDVYLSAPLSMHSHFGIHPFLLPSNSKKLLTSGNFDL